VSNATRDGVQMGEVMQETVKRNTSFGQLVQMRRLLNRAASKSNNGE